MKKKCLAALLIFNMVFLFIGCGAQKKDVGSADGAKNISSAEESAEETFDPEHLQKDTSNVPEGHLRVAWGRDIASTDIQVASYYNFIITMNIYDTLFKIGYNNKGEKEIQPSIASGYDLSPDGRTYRITLRDDVRFSDGSYLTAEDVAYTLTRMLLVEGGDLKIFSDMIVGAEELESGEADSFAGIHIEDDRHIDITLKEPFSGYIYQLAAPSCAIYSKAFTEQSGDLYGTAPEYTLGSGAYVLDKMGDVCELSLNPYYWGEKPSVSSVEVFRLEPTAMTSNFLDGKLDLLIPSQSSSNYYTEFEKEKWQERIIHVEPLNMRYLFMNASFEPLDDVRVRKAIQLAIDREKILREVFNSDGNIVDGLLPRSLTGFCPENQGWLSYDPKEAERLLKEAGAYETAELEIAVSIQKDSRFRNMIAMIASQLNEAGLHTKVINYSNDGFVYLRRLNKIMMYSGRWDADYDDPDSFMYSMFGNPFNSNYYSISYRNDAVMDRIRLARSIINPKERMAEYAELEKKIVQEDAAVVPLFTTNVNFLLGDRVNSFTPYWEGMDYMYFSDVELK